MSLHSPFKYCSNEMDMIRTIIDMLDRFCTPCHSDEDYSGGCRGCPVGNLIYACKGYVATAFIPKTDNQYAAKYYEELKKLSMKIRYLRPCPNFNASWVFDEEPAKDRIEGLRRTLKNLEFYHGQANHPLLNMDKLNDQKEALLDSYVDHGKELDDAEGL